MMPIVLSVSAISMIRYFAASEVEEEVLEEDGTTTASTLSYEYRTINSKNSYFGSIV